MPSAADLALSELLIKNQVLPPELLQAELEVVDRILVLGLKMNLARALKDRQRLDAAGIEKTLSLPISPEKQGLLAEQIRWLKAPTPVEPPILDAAVQHGLLAGDDLAQALRLQEQVKALGVDKRPLEILIDQGVLAPEAAMALFDVIREPGNALLRPADLSFCRLAAERGAATPRDLQAAVATQRRLKIKFHSRRPVGELLYAQGRIARTRLAEIQDFVRARHPEEDPAKSEAIVTTEEIEAKIAEVLARTEAVSPTQMQECLRLRESLREFGLQRRLGEVLLQRGLLRVDQLDALLSAAAARESAAAAAPAAAAPGAVPLPVPVAFPAPSPASPALPPSPVPVAFPAPSPASPALPPSPVPAPFPAPSPVAPAPSPSPVPAAFPSRSAVPPSLPASPPAPHRVASSPTLGAVPPRAGSSGRLAAVKAGSARSASGSGSRPAVARTSSGSRPAVGRVARPSRPSTATIAIVFGALFAVGITAGFVLGGRGKPTETATRNEAPENLPAADPASTRTDPVPAPTNTVVPAVPDPGKKRTEDDDFWDEGKGKKGPRPNATEGVDTSAFGTDEPESGPDPRTSGPAGTAVAVGGPGAGPAGVTPDPAGAGSAGGWADAVEAPFRRTLERADRLWAEGKRDEAIKGVRGVATQAPAGAFRDFVASRAATMEAAAALIQRIVDHVKTAGKPVPVKALAEFGGMAGRLKEVSAAQVTLATSQGAQLGKSWRDLSVAAVEEIAVAALGASTDVTRDLALWASLSGSAEDADRLWSQAEKAGADLVAFQAYRTGRVQGARRADYARALAEAERFAAAGKVESALAEFARLRERFGGASDLDLSALDRREGELRDAWASELLQRVRDLRDAGRIADAFRELDAGLPRARRSSSEPDLEVVRQGLLESVVTVLGDFDSPDSVLGWQSLNSGAQPTAAEGTWKAGGGAMRWSIQDGDTAGVTTTQVPTDWSGFAAVSFWVRTDAPGRTRIGAAARSNPNDYLVADLTLDFTGWKFFRIPLDRMQRVNRGDLRAVTEFGFWHWPDTPAANVCIDEVRLEKAEAAAILGGGEAAGIASGSGPRPGGGSGSGGDPGPDPGGSGGPGGPGRDPGGVPGGTPGGSAGPRISAGIPDSAATKGWPRATRRHYVNLDYGIGIVGPEGWEGMPAPKEMNEIYRDFEQVKGVVRFLDKNADSTNRETSMDVTLLPNQKDLDAAVKFYLSMAGGVGEPTGVRNAKIGPWESRAFQLDAGSGWVRTVTIVHAVDRAVSIVVNAGERLAKKKGAQFFQQARTFLFLTEEQVRKLRSGGGRINTLPAGWKAHLTPHYEVQYNCETEYAKKVGLHLEAILKEYRRRWPMEAKLDEMTGSQTGTVERFTVKVFEKQAEFTSYAAANGVTGAAAYFSPMQDELVCYKTSDEGKEKTFHILYHEASHQYIHLYMGREVDIPTWLNEGVAEYFFGGEFQANGSFTIGVNRERIGTMKEALRTNKYVLLEEIFRYTQAQYYANSEMCYAEGWAIAYFLWRTPNKLYAGRLDKYYEVLRSTGDAEQARSEAFGDLDMARFEEDWKKFIMDL